MICGHCKRSDQNITVSHVRACQMGQPSAEVVSAGFRDVPVYEVVKEPVTEEGLYFTGAEYAKVQRSKSGFLYAKVWDDDTESWDYTAGLLRLMTADMKVTAEQAKQFGDQTHRCIFCTKELTDDRPGCSIERGYGETCAGNNGLPWGAVA